ncbi:hypothetical protein [Herbaspirillum sp.]|uniref:hypothetical protein n=1 Tax=Herbaspirillum TaxID=963 RepID=UPI0025846A9B|nr:hypothetical protein [Herbaspirillum sp.]MCP3654585.1 hypothetical protein [Herbaspirillum sp.]MCP3948669.1 hypothetical protein [Herbaspirillum sp.]MCP4033248.1 hypothetical protein [Herbaspirillum sp.]MCP4556199.1 hypothetical protein [Herbaspirillum sp.]
MTTDNASPLSETGPPCVLMAHQILDQLSEMYRLLGILKSAADFREKILGPIIRECVDPNTIEDNIENSADVSNVEMMYLSAAYAAGGLASHEAGDHENAWLGISHAQYWMGLALGTGFSGGAVNSALSTRGKSGASKRNAKYEPLREFAKELATAKKYRSRRNAALSIKEPVFNKAKKLGVYLSEQQAEKTLTSWLDDIQFPPKK